MRYLASVLGFVCLTACQVHQATPKSYTPPSRMVTSLAESSIQHGLTHIYFENWEGPRIPVWVYVPRSVDPRSAPVLIMMHGAKRGAARYLSEWDQIADNEGFIIIAPEFTREAFPGSAGYNLGNRVSRQDGSAIPRPKWSFAAIEPIFDHVVDQLGNKQQEYTLYGHSAGSQFVHRFMYFYPQSRAKRILAANAGWYTFPDPQKPFPVGLEGVEMDDAKLKAILEKDVFILLGDADNDPNHSSLKRDDGVGAQGPHRFARGLNFYQKGKDEADRLNAKFGWDIRIVKGVAHSNGGIAAASGDLIE